MALSQPEVGGERVLALPVTRSYPPAECVDDLIIRMGSSCVGTERGLLKQNCELSLGEETQGGVPSLGSWLEETHREQVQGSPELGCQRPWEGGALGETYWAKQLRRSSAGPGHRDKMAESFRVAQEGKKND